MAIVAMFYHFSHAKDSAQFSYAGVVDPRGPDTPLIALQKSATVYTLHSESKAMSRTQPAIRIREPLCFHMPPRATEDTAGDSGNVEYVGSAAGKSCVKIWIVYTCSLYAFFCGRRPSRIPLRCGMWCGTLWNVLFVTETLVRGLEGRSPFG